MLEVKDEYSLIEFLYLSVVDPELLKEDIVVNPKGNAMNKIVISNDGIHRAIKCKMMIDRTIDKYKDFPIMNILPDLVSFKQGIHEFQGYYFFPKSDLGDPAHSFINHQISSKLLAYKLYKYFGLNRTSISNYNKLLDNM